MRVAIIDPSGFTLPYDHCLATALTQQGCQVVLATARMQLGPWAQDIAYVRWEDFYRIASRLTRTKIRSYIKGCEHPFDMERLFRYLRRYKPDIIHFQWVSLAAFDGIFLRRLRKIAPLVLTVHDSEPYHGAPSSRFQLMGLFSTFRYFEHYIVHTRYSKEALVCQLGLPKHRISVIPHGVFTYYRDLVSGLKCSEKDLQLASKKKILFFGLLKPYKGVDFLLEAFSRFVEKRANEAILQIVGYPRMPIKPLQELAVRLGIDHCVSWDLRFVDEKEVAAYFSQADVVVLPYRRIDQSGVLMIAMAFGKPVIASRVGGFSETIEDGVTGFLFEPGDVEMLARVLDRVLNDNELRWRIVSAIEKLASGDLSWNNIAEHTMRLYDEIIRAGVRIKGL